MERIARCSKKQEYRPASCRRRSVAAVALLLYAIPTFRSSPENCGATHVKSTVTFPAPGRIGNKNG